MAGNLKKMMAAVCCPSGVCENATAGSGFTVCQAGSFRREAIAALNCAADIARANMPDNEPGRYAEGRLGAVAELADSAKERE